MTNAHDPVSFPTDPYPVRPGTSAALTARTIDATVHPPLVRAQETVVALVPRLTETLGSPLFIGSLAGTLVLLWLARRAKFRPAGLLLPAVLMMTLTSFRPAGRDDNNVLLPIPEPTPFIFEAPRVREPPPPRAAKRRAPPRERSFGSELLAAFPEVMIVAKLNAEMIAQNAEMFAQDERELRAYVKALRRQLRAEARRIARNR